MDSLLNTPHAQINNSDRILQWFHRHWLLTASCLFGIYAVSPFLAPVFMENGLILPAKIIYWVYSFFCHQLPERSYFLFGSSISYSLAEIQSAWQNTTDAAILRQFIGNSQMGWKVAWSDRMVAMWTSLWIVGMIWGLLKKKVRPLPWWGLLVLILPLAIDGATHLISDLAGIGQGFRDSNVWLVTLTGNTLSASFYAGDAWGSFNAWMRLISGVLFGWGIVWSGFPFLDDAIRSSVEVINFKYQHELLRQAGRKYLDGLTPSAEPLSTQHKTNIENRPGES